MWFVFERVVQRVATYTSQSSTISASHWLCMHSSCSTVPQRSSSSLSILYLSFWQWSRWFFCPIGKVSVFKCLRVHCWTASCLWWNLAFSNIILYWATVLDPSMLHLTEIRVFFVIFVHSFVFDYHQSNLILLLHCFLIYLMLLFLQVFCLQFLKKLVLSTRCILKTAR